VDTHRTAWLEASRRVAADSRFDGFELAPQLGLIPLGPDPDSRLEEFAHFASGAAPARAADGGLPIDGASAIVLVLVPGMQSLLGAVPPSDARPLGAAHVDPWCGEWDGPIRHVSLAPYFIAKHELTRGQFRRHTGADPSSLAPEDARSRADRDRVPVETISWATATRVLGELDLELPTEAQWEFAARAGTTGDYWWPGDASGARDKANIADAKAKQMFSSWGWAVDHDDGFALLAPAGSFKPNPNGLRDILGNVWEWCADAYDDKAYGKGGVDVADPFFDAGSSRVLRGGSFSNAPIGSRCAHRGDDVPGDGTDGVGFRAARTL
jgi:formylglycine-generating enzyme required for sulfatase activity